MCQIRMTPVERVKARTRGVGSGAVAIVNSTVTGGSTGQVTFEQMLGGEGVNHPDTRAEHFEHREGTASANRSRSRPAACEGPQAGPGA